MRIVQQQRKGYLLLRFLIFVNCVCSVVRNMTYCTVHNSYQIVPFTACEAIYACICFLVAMCVQEGLRQGESLWQLLFVLEFYQKASYLYSILENVMDSNGVKIQSKTVHPAKRECLFKTCNNYSAKEAIQDFIDTSLFYYDFRTRVQQNYQTTLQFESNDLN